MVTLVSEDCEVRSERRGEESVLVCLTPKEKCQKQIHNPNVEVIIGEFSTLCTEA